MWCIQHDKILEDWMYHDPNIANKRGWTVAMYLIWNNAYVLDGWHHNPYMRSKSWSEPTVALILAERKLPIPKEWYHDPTTTDKYGNTVAMLYRRFVPKEWEHDPSLKNNSGHTLAMLMVTCGSADIPD